ncbi:bifunctional glycosyltransferase/CDP-glycerol:glycerophosphate glycerophosphotransferase [Streptomyces spiralis]
MPRFSVIVPVYQVQACLPECLESVLSQSFMDLELIAVDDCSPDACGAIVDGFAARDPRVRAVHLTENQGPARARDAGLDRATGDYLVLLDGGDTLTPDALWSVERRLKETGEPDVLVYDCARTDRNGRAVPGDVTWRLGEDGPAPFRPADRPDLFRSLTVAWNKACRRDFVEREGLTFPADLHGDTPWTYPVLPAAASVATLDRVCVRHRQRRPDGVPHAAGRRHRDVPGRRHDRMSALIGRRPDPPLWPPVPLHGMGDPLPTLPAASSGPGRLPRGCRAKFLRRARAYHRRHLAPGVRLPLRPRLRPALVRLALHRAFRALRMATALRRRTAKAVVKSLRALRTVLLRAHHRIRLCPPARADRSVFSASTTPRCRRPDPDMPPAGRRRPARILTGGYVRGFRSAQLRAVFRERFCPCGDGRAAERMVRYVVFGHGVEAAGPPPVVPLAERHPVPWPAAAPVRSRLATVSQPAGRQTVTDDH